jgi:hypothetical protein
MIRQIRIVTLAIIAILIFNTGITFAQFNVSKAESTTANRGVFYSLPQNYLIIDVVVEETASFAGPYADFSYKYLGLDKVIKSDKSEFQITSIQVQTETQPDPAQSYFVEIPPKSSSKDSRSVLLSLDQAGIINAGSQSQTAIDIESYNRKKYTHTVSSNTINKDDLFNYVLRPGMMEITDTIIKVITIDTTFIQDIRYENRFVDMSIEQQAANAKEKIDMLRKERHKLLTGYQEIAYEGEAIRFMHDQLKKQEDEYMAMFTGKKITRTHSYRFYYTPKQEDINSNVPVFKFSKFNGLSEKGSGEYVFIKFESNNITENISSSALKVESANTGQHGFYYRIPEYADISLIYKGEKMSNDKFMIPQFGVVSYIPFGNDIKIELHPETGTIKSLYLE